MLYFLIFLPGYSCDIWFLGGLIHPCFPAPCSPEGLCALCSASPGGGKRVVSGDAGWWYTGNNRQIYRMWYCSTQKEILFSEVKLATCRHPLRFQLCGLLSQCLYSSRVVREATSSPFDRIIEVRLSTLTCTFQLFSQPASFIPSDEAWPVLLPCCSLVLR